MLSDGRFHSGEALSASLGLSRSAVWKYVKGLTRLGVEVHAVRGRGYRLGRDVELLSAAAIRAALPAAAQKRIGGLEIHDTLDSTNAQLLRALDTGVVPGSACLAEHQQSGRGRLGRRWVSPYAANVYLSLYWELSTPPALLQGLGLAVGVATARALNDAGFADAQLKWPNDLVWRDAKLGGILIELAGEVYGRCRAVVGVGLNVAMPAASAAEIECPWTDLQTAMGRSVSRNRICAALLHRLIDALARYDREGLAPFLEEWRRRDAFRDRPVTVHTPHATVSGIARGIDEQGSLLIERGGEVRRYYAGDVSLRPESEPDSELERELEPEPESEPEAQS